MICYLDGPRLRRALAAGIAQLLGQEDLLNRINVFPVPDGDTGTNLALTARAMLPVIQGSTTRAVGESLSEIADAALDGARGNSGAILAQFLHGLSDASSDSSRLTPEEFTSAVGEGVVYARSAIEEPREGTMLTVLELFRRELDRLRESAAARDFSGLMQSIFPALERGLAATKDQLDVLAKADVVDAGAAGVVAMIQGTVGLLRGETLPPLPELSAGDSPAFSQATASTRFRYCTECFVSAAGIDSRRLRESLAGLGDSLVVAGSQRKLKIHIHSDEPDAVFLVAARFGEVSGRKADDMARQAASAAHGNELVAIITDSACDIPEDECERLNIHSVPLRVHLGERSYLDKVSLSYPELYRQLSDGSGPMKTSQPPPGDFRRLFEYLGSHFDSVLSVQLSGQVSGTLQSARAAAARVSPKGKVQVIDSRNVSLGQGLITLYAAECAESGMTRSEITARLEQVIARTRTFGIVTDLAFAVRGGRVPRSRKLIADLLRVTPVLRTVADGGVKADRVLLGRRRTLEKFARHVARQCDPALTYRLAVGHGDEAEAAASLLQMLCEHLPKIERHFVTEVGAALGVHAGPGLLVVALHPVELQDP